MKIDTQKRIELIRHMSRLEGQLSAVKRELQSENPNCMKASNTLSAASRSFGSFRRSFIECFLELKHQGKGASVKLDEEYEALMRVVNS